MDAAQIADWLRLFLEPGQVTELRALDYAPGGKYPSTVAGYFDYEHLDKMGAEAVRISPAAVGVYFIPNPIQTDLLARCCNRVKGNVKEKDLTQDRHIARRKWFLVDADPVRPDGISSTDAEKAGAKAVIDKAADFLRTHGFGGQVVADSGNGYHLLCKIELDRDDGFVIRNILNSLANRFDTDLIKIDRKVFNPARIVKLYGTWSRKGDHTELRPHRLSRVITP